MTTPVIFIGSAPFSVTSLQTLLDHQVNVVQVITRQDKPTGRGLRISPNPVKILAEKYHLPVLTEMNPNDLIITPETIGLVAAYGTIIPQNILDIFNNQLLNIHPSLLPKYRGPSPLQSQILDGITETGVTIIQLDHKMDHGPIIAQEKDPLSADDTKITLGHRLFTKGSLLFINYLNQPTKYPPTPQDDSQATFTKLLTRDHGFVPWDQFTQELNSQDLHLNRLWRAYQPWPGVWTNTPENKRLKLVSFSPIQVQIEGKNPQPWPL